MIGGLEGLGGGRFVRTGGALVFQASGMGCQVTLVMSVTLTRLVLEMAGTEFVNDHSSGGGSVGDSQPATKNSSVRLIMIPTDLNTRIFCGRKNQTQAVLRQELTLFIF